MDIIPSLGFELEQILNSELAEVEYDDLFQGRKLNFSQFATLLYRFRYK